MSKSGLIRQLKILNSEKKKLKENKTEQNASNFVSYLALIISILSIYLQFFYESFDLNASVIDANIKQDSINLDLIYHNKGNQDATIISSEIFFFSDLNKNSPENHFQFIRDKQEPFILSPGRQTFTKLSQKVFFDEKDLLLNNNTNHNDTLRINLKINYLRENSLQSEKVVECGWITLDSISKIDYWLIKYQKVELDSDEYFINSYRPKTDK